MATFTTCLLVVAKVWCWVRFPCNWLRRHRVMNRSAMRCLTKKNNALFEIPGTQIDGGMRWGLLNFRRDALDVAQNALNHIAIGFAQSMNSQHLLGWMSMAPVAKQVSSQQEFCIKSFAADLRIAHNSKTLAR